MTKIKIDWNWQKIDQNWPKFKKKFKNFLKNQGWPRPALVTEAGSVASQGFLDFWKLAKVFVKNEIPDTVYPL